MSTTSPQRTHARKRGKGKALAAYVQHVLAAGAAGISTADIAQAEGVLPHGVAHVLAAAVEAGQVVMVRRYKAPAMWYAAGLAPSDQAGAMGQGRALTVKTKLRLVLDHNQPTVVPPTVRVTRCPTRWA